MEVLRRWSCLAVLTLAVSVPTRPSAADERPEVVLRSGDVVFQQSRSRQSFAIQLATSSRWSHVGIVERTPEGVFVLEAIQPVSRTPWERWRLRGRGDVLVLRPRGIGAMARARVVEEARRALGKPYDPRFGWGDDRLYCSELVVKAYQRGAGVSLGRRERLGDLRIAPVRPAIRARWGEVPEDLVVVTPASLAGDPRLGEVYRGP